MWLPRLERCNELGRYRNAAAAGGTLGRADETLLVGPLANANGFLAKIDVAPAQSDISNFLLN